jgi:hypothetical protein
MCDNRLVRLVRSERAVRVAFALWFVLALLVWNVVFDRVIVVAGRQYVHAAAAAAGRQAPPELIDEWMPPAVARAARLATIAGAAVLSVGVAATAVAAARRRRLEEFPCPPSHTR